jgi:hypothetical protein
MANDTALLPPRIATLARVAALDAYKTLRLDRLLDADRRVVYEDTFVDDDATHPASSIPFEDVPRYVAFSSRHFFGYDDPDAAAFFDDDRDAAVQSMLDDIDAFGMATPVRDHRSDADNDGRLACLDLDTGEWLRFRRASLVSWEETSPPLDLGADVTFDPFPDETGSLLGPAWPRTVALTATEVAAIREAEAAWKSAQAEARAIGDACVRAALAREGVTLHPAYLTYQRGLTVAREVLERFNVDHIDSRNDAHEAYISARFVGGRRMREAVLCCGIDTDDAVLSLRDLEAVASVLNLPLRVSRTPFDNDDAGADDDEREPTPVRYGRNGDDGLAFRDVAATGDAARTWVILWEGGQPPARIWERVRAVLEMKGIAVTTEPDGLRVPMTYRPTIAGD